MSLAASIHITDQDIYQVSNVANAELLGQVATTSDGRAFAYAKAGANLTAGQITQPEAVTANYANRTLAVGAAQGDNQVTIPLGTTATSDQFVGAWLVVNDGVGEGQGVYYITGNTAATAGNSNTTTVSIDGALRAALTNASDVTILPNQEGSVITHTAAVAVATAGAPVLTVTSGQYFWNQVQGMASILSQGVVTKNAGVIPSASVAGAVAIEVAATVTQRVGYAPEATVDTEYSPVVLTLVGL